MKTIRYLFRHPLQVLIAMGVLGTHFCIFYYAYHHKSFFSVRVKPKPLVVTTRIYQPPPPKPKAVVKKAAQTKKQGKVVAKKKPAVKKKPPLPKKKTLVAKTPLKIPSPKKNAPLKASPLKKIAPEEKAPLKVPTPINALKVDKEVSMEPAVQYRDNLVAFLQNELKLPEIGSVTLKLSLQANGKVLQVIILSSESENNKAYLEGLLPNMEFPMFGKELGQKKNHTFTLTFCNEN